MRLPDNPSDRLVLVFAVASEPYGEIDPIKLVAFFRSRADGATAVAASLNRLREHGLVTVDTHRLRVRYRRTNAEVVVGERLLRDGRVSFRRVLAAAGGSGFRQWLSSKGLPRHLLAGR